MQSTFCPHYLRALSHIASASQLPNTASFSTGCRYEVASRNDRAENLYCTVLVKGRSVEMVRTMARLWEFTAEKCTITGMWSTYILLLIRSSYATKVCFRRKFVQVRGPEWIHTIRSKTHKWKVDGAWLSGIYKRVCCAVYSIHLGDTEQCWHSLNNASSLQIGCQWFAVRPSICADSFQIDKQCQSSNILNFAWDVSSTSISVTCFERTSAPLLTDV